MTAEHYKGNKADVSEEHLGGIGKLLARHSSSRCSRGIPNPMSYGGQYFQKSLSRAEFFAIIIWLRSRDEDPVDSLEFEPQDHQVGIACLYSQNFQQALASANKEDWNTQIKPNLAVLAPSLRALVACLHAIDPRFEPLEMSQNFRDFAAPDDKD